MNDHIHSWTILAAPDKLQCRKCDTVSTIATLLSNTAADAAKATKLHILSKQLFAGELKKPAHDAAYMWVRTNSADISSHKAQQDNGVLAL